MNEILKAMKNIIESSDGGDPGHLGARSIWLFGIEPGDSKADQTSRESGNTRPRDDDYSVGTQMQWVFNQNAFKLLAAIDGKSVYEFESFAKGKNPFVKGCSGYFKGNLYPVASNNLDAWSKVSQEEMGCDKKEFYEWCRKERYPEIQNFVEKFRPRLIIGVGVGHRNEFLKAFFNDGSADFLVHRSEIKQRVRRLYYKEKDGVKLVVIPHLSPRGPYCLSSYDAIQKAGEFIADWINDQASS